jgi:hypothetical protein
VDRRYGLLQITYAVIVSAPLDPDPVPTAFAVHPPPAVG